MQASAEEEPEQQVPSCEEPSASTDIFAEPETLASHPQRVDAETARVELELKEAQRRPTLIFQNLFRLKLATRLLGGMRAFLSICSLPASTPFFFYIYICFG